jgi:cell division protein ZapE
MSGFLDIYQAQVASGAIRPDPQQALAAEVFARLSNALVSYRPDNGASLAQRVLRRRASVAPRGVYLHGGVGRGKTMLMDMFFTHAPVAKKRRVHFHAFMLEVHDYLHRERANTDGTDSLLIDCAAWIASQATLLCFDEFQVKDVADAMILGRLFSALFKKGVVVVMTSNIAPDDLYTDGLQRDRFLPFIALLKEKTDVVMVNGASDYRLDRLIGRKVYFWPHDADAASELDRIFRDVADGHAGEARDIAVKGRIIHVPRAEKEVAWFTFADLCGQARSAVDYLELIRNFSVFVLADVPKMDDRQRNEALRFITLVDTLYDSGARLVMSAAALPEKLYTGDDHAHVFQRTVSRLMEMQSRGYGEKKHV